MDELRASILRVQLRKLPQIVSGMRASKYRLREGLKKFPQIKLRKIIDEAGDTGCFLLTTFSTPAMAREVNDALRAEGIVTFAQGMSNIVMTEWGLHVYYNIPSLVHKTSVDKLGFPWSLTENQNSRMQYAKGTCPTADGLFERTVLIAVPSCLTEKDEQDILLAFDKVLSAIAD
jgi:dTDP-4-amino-4,6-dideoxygalactose transaminase